ncbi:response regulator [Balneolaceae bacterium YR4-1]|uniref:Response regulator n=1 Tax=Halalkalibaculum roseum TaxID=2709311 RepID=A0A6M1SM40_9BACT|nr:response regulator [Halalkalibaculum roseum]NGP76401.1 response regulator [Halalkalibaculum roseum]
MKILIIEDDRLISLMLTKMVQKMGHEVLGAYAKGEAAVSAIDEMHVDLILMDIMLEDNMDGIEAMQKIQSKNDSIPVIYITGNSDESTKLRASKTNYEAYLVKPVTFSQLQQIIGAL